MERGKTHRRGKTWILRWVTVVTIEEIILSNIHRDKARECCRMAGLYSVCRVREEEVEVMAHCVVS